MFPGNGHDISERDIPNTCALYELSASTSVLLSRLRRDLPRDLEVICFQCLEKRPRDRYAKALELGDDLRRYLRGEPLKARPPGMLSVSWKWCQRKSLAAVLAALAVLLPLVGLGALLVHNRQLEALAGNDRAKRTCQRAHQSRPEAPLRKTGASSNHPHIPPQPTGRFWGAPEWPLLRCPLTPLNEPVRSQSRATGNHRDRENRCRRVETNGWDDGRCRTDVSVRPRP